MLPELNKLLINIQAALPEIQEFIAGMDLNSYRSDSKCKTAVERKFELENVGACVDRIRSSDLLKFKL
jgi:uncharacterized protein with HEPN domain